MLEILRRYLAFGDGSPWSRDRVVLLRLRLVRRRVGMNIRVFQRMTWTTFEARDFGACRSSHRETCSLCRRVHSMECSDVE